MSRASLAFTRVNSSVGLLETSTEACFIQSDTFIRVALRLVTLVNL